MPTASKGCPIALETRAAGSFRKAKAYLMAAPVLVHYQDNCPLSITYDVSSYGIGAVLAHPQKDMHLILSQLLRENIHKWIASLNIFCCAEI